MSRISGSPQAGTNAHVVGTASSASMRQQERPECSNATAPIPSNESGMSPYFDRVNEIYHALLEDPGREITYDVSDAALLEELCLAGKKSEDKQLLCEYTEGGNEIYRSINDHLRFLKPDACAQKKSDELLKIFDELDSFEGVAYRFLTVRSEIYDKKIKSGDLIIDTGFMSASALPQNAIRWMKDWGTEFMGDHRENVILVLDETVPKRIATTQNLLDHILVRPNTILTIKDIQVVGKSSECPITLVGVEGTDGLPDKDVYNLFSGVVELRFGGDSD